MNFGQDVTQEAKRLLENRRTQRKNEVDAVRVRAYALDPRLEEIDKELRRTIPRLLKASINRRKGAVKAFSCDEKSEIREENQRLQEERRQRLQALQIPLESVSELPLCEHCNDSGIDGQSMCQCLIGTCKEVQVRKLGEQLGGIRGRFELFQVERYGEEGSPTRQAMETVYFFCAQYASQFPHGACHSMVLNGAVGLGKTFLAAAVARHVAEKGYAAVYKPSLELFGIWNMKTFQGGSEEEVKQAEREVRQFFRCDLLIIDDLGSEMTNVPVQTALYELLNTRLIRGKHTVITTNFDLHEMTRRYSAPTVSRIQGEYQRLEFRGVEDIRKQEKRERY